MQVYIVKEKVVAGEVRQRMAESAAVLLAKQGVQATSFADVLERARAPRGSVYHHFPGGKDQLVAAALEVAGGRLRDLLDSWAGGSPTSVTSRFLDAWRLVLTRSDFGAGCAVVAVTVAADSPDLIAQAAAIFRDWRRRLAVLLESAGVPAATAGSFAATLVAASEGAVVLSRAERSMEPFDQVAAHLVEDARRLE